MSLPTNTVLSMDLSRSHTSLYRILRRHPSSTRIVYLTVHPGILNEDEFVFPPDAFRRFSQYPQIWNSEKWKTLEISLGEDGQLVMREDVGRERHRLGRDVVDSMMCGREKEEEKRMADWMDVGVERRFNHRVFRVRFPKKGEGDKEEEEEEEAILKIARFEFELAWLANEVSVYRELELESSRAAGLHPRFLGFVFERDQGEGEGGDDGDEEEKRVMGFLREEIEGRAAREEDFRACEDALGRLHRLGILHGDLNRHNMIVGTDGKVRFIDFEDAVLSADGEGKRVEMERLREVLRDTSGRGAPLSP